MTTRRTQLPLELRGLDDAALRTALAETHAAVEAVIPESEIQRKRDGLARAGEVLLGFHKGHPDLRPLSVEMSRYLVLDRASRRRRSSGCRLRRQSCVGRARTPRSRSRCKAGKLRGSPPNGEDGEHHPSGLGDTAGSSSLATPLLKLHAAMLVCSAAIDGTSIYEYAEKVVPYLVEHPALLPPFWAAVEYARGLA